MATIDQKQHDVADWLVNQSLATDPSKSAVINLAGAVGSGKTSVLRLAEKLFRQRGKTPVFLSAPAADVETSAIVLAEAADCLDHAGCLNGEGDVLRDPKKRWIEKFNAVTKLFDSEPEQFVVVCDEPSHWFRKSTSGVDDTPDHHARLLSDWVFKQSECRRVVSGYVPTGLPRLQQTRAPRIVDGRELLNDSAFWATAADLATAVSTGTKRSIEYRSVMEIRLLVAWAWLFSPNIAAKQCEVDSNATSLLESLLDELELSALQNIDHEAFCRAMARLAIGRTGLPNHVFNELTSDLSELDRDVLRGCLCEEWPERALLHPLVRHEVLTRARDRKRADTTAAWKLLPEDRMAVHNRMFHVANQHSSGTSWRTDLEALHHGVLSGQIETSGSDTRLHFVEQLHEIGRTLSYVHRRHEQAADVFRLALALDEENAYSHHYLAFNLDWNAQTADEVEAHYCKAIELQPEHPWWWSRWISYLATRGRFKEAGNQWRDALDALSVTEDSTPEWVYMSLHRWVARWMLHWSNLDLAESILRSLPSDLMGEASICRLNDLLLALRFAERDQAVFPLSVPARDWWSRTPHTNLPPVLPPEDLPLQSWIPARIQHIEQNEKLFLLTGKWTRNPADPIEFGELDLDRPTVEQSACEFQWSDLSEGQFIEIGYYGDANVMQIGLHKSEEWRDPDLIPLVPPPNRWYEHAVANSWQDATGD